MEGGIDWSAGGEVGSRGEQMTSMPPTEKVKGAGEAHSTLPTSAEGMDDMEEGEAAKRTSHTAEQVRGEEANRSEGEGQREGWMER